VNVYSCSLLVLLESPRVNSMYTVRTERIISRTNERNLVSRLRFEGRQGDITG